MRRFEEVDSTNRWLLDEARRGAPEGLVAVADHQTAGRGRRGRTWEAPPAANLLMSVLLRPVEPGPGGQAPLPVDRLHLVTAAVALAGRSAAASVAGVEATLKWPNDLLVDDAKLAGVLAESSLPAVVVGIGLNVAWAPPGAACLGADVARDEVLDVLLTELDARYGRWDEVAVEHRRACSTVGRQVRVELDDETFTGVAADITDDGHLLVDVGMCLRTITAADVIHLHRM